MSIRDAIELENIDIGSNNKKLTLPSGRCKEGYRIFKKGGAEMWINLYRLLTNLRRRRIDPRDVTVYVDDELLDPGHQRQQRSHSPYEEDEPAYEENEEIEED